MALQKEIWISDIESNLFANNKFMDLVGKNDSAYAAYKTVHVPQAGSKPNVLVDRQNLPAPITQRTDTELTYNLSEYTTDPILIQNTEEVQLSYNKRMDILSDHIKQLGYVAAQNALYKWAATGAGRIVRTTGAASTVIAPGATGTRKAITLQDIQDALSILGQDDVNPDDEKYIIMPAQIYWSQFVGIDKISKYLEFGQNTAVLPSGVVNKILGMNVIIRSSVVVFDNTGTPVIKTIGATGNVTTTAATDNMAIEIISKNAVRQALGETKVFGQNDAPEYYGDIFSALVLHGAAKARTNQEGIVSIVQAA